MRQQQQTLLALIAAGRITAAEALQLESIWAARRQQVLEVFGAIALCVLILVAQSTQTTAAVQSLGHSAIHLIQHVAGGAR
ncbi:MAG: hypothetical protein KGN79_01480 [Acidobacteriota bacterium]|nr:hypothetical protein [Acidobacteriota bacterium]